MVLFLTQLLTSCMTNWSHLQRFLYSIYAVTALCNELTIGNDFKQPSPTRSCPSIYSTWLAFEVCNTDKPWLVKSVLVITINNLAFFYFMKWLYRSLFSTPACLITWPLFHNLGCLFIFFCVWQTQMLCSIVIIMSLFLFFACTGKRIIPHQI